jgi:hypothetical protein
MNNACTLRIIIVVVLIRQLVEAIRSHCQPVQKENCSPHRPSLQIEDGSILYPVLEPSYCNTLLHCVTTLQAPEL